MDVQSDKVHDFMDPRHVRSLDPKSLGQPPRWWSTSGRVCPAYQRSIPRIRRLLGLCQVGFGCWAVYGLNGIGPLLDFVKKIFWAQ